MLTPALPFCHCELKAEKPSDFRYPTEIKTLGDQLRARWLDLGLYQKDVAAKLGVSEDTICHWESGRVKPSRVVLTKIVGFLGSDTGE